MTVADSGGHSTLFRVEKWDADQIAWTRRRLDRPPGWEPGLVHLAAARVAPFEVYEKPDANRVLDAGWQMLMRGVTSGQVITQFSQTVGRIGASDTTGTPAYTDTGLFGATNNQWVLCGAAPVAGATHTAGIAWSAVFGQSLANWTWADFGVDSGTGTGTGAAATAPFFSHGTASPGAKTSAQVWNVSVTVTWT